MSDDTRNPYEPSQAANLGAPHQRVYQFTQLPRVCPSCNRQFSDNLYHRLYRRRFRVGTLLFFLALVVASCILIPVLAMIRPIVSVVFVISVLIPLGSWAMRWHKKVRVYCNNCGWAETYIVSARG